MGSFGVNWPERRPPEEALAGFIAAESPVIGEGGFQQSGRTASSTTYTRRRLGPWGFVAGLLTFPFGILIWIFYRRDESFSVSAQPMEDGSLVRVRGEMPAGLAATMAELATARRMDHELGRAGGKATTPDRPPEPERAADPSITRRGGPDHSEMAAELERIYVELGAPEGIAEATAKVRALARELAADANWDEDQALVIAYQRSLEEHRAFLASRRQAAGR
jgi:hypothetical protein